MNGRFYMSALFFGLLFLLFAVVVVPAEEANAKTLFPLDLPSSNWVRFNAVGFSESACGVIYRLKEPACNGMPLGGVDTGCIDLETSGLWGYCTIFNTHVPRRGPLNLPFLGLSVGESTWVMCDPKQIKEYEFDKSHFRPPVEPIPTELALEGVKLPKEIHYWGHYPVADLVYETDSPIEVGLRTWAPFIPGDVVSSMIPAAVFEVHLQNKTHVKQAGSIAFSFPGPSLQEAGADQFERNVIKEKGFSGVEMKAPKASYVLGVVGQESIRFGGELGANGNAWIVLGKQLPDPKKEEPGASIAVDFALGAGESRIVRFVLSWCSPEWKGGGHPTTDKGNTFTHMYVKHYPAALDAVHEIARNHESLLKRILAWQEVIYTDETLPIWLRDSLVNYLYLITEDGLWAQAKPPLPDWIKPEDGLFGMNESPRACPQIECIPCSFYGNMPMVYFFPELALSTLRGYKGYQFPDGAAPWVFGGVSIGTEPVDFAMPGRSYQMTTDGICYASMVDRYRMCWGNKEFVQEFYESVKKNTIYTINLRAEGEIGDRVISMPSGEPGIGGSSGTTWFEHPSEPWVGMVTHVGGLHLAQLQITQRIAELAGDTEFAQQCRDWFEAGSQSLESKMWNESYYLSFWEPETSKKNDMIFAFQLDGQWITELHGLQDVFRPDRVKTTLAAIKAHNLSLSPYGAVTWTNPSKTAQDELTGGGYTLYGLCPAEICMLAMNYMYEGQRDLGVELTRQITHHMVIRLRRGWNLPIHMRADTGEVTLGYDYYQNMMLWSLPAALASQPFNGPCQPSGLVYRIRRAGQKR